MNFIATKFDTAFVIETTRRGDERGYFERLYCTEELKSIGFTKQIVQINHSKSKDIGTLRGMHFQAYPKCETKIIQCIKGRIFDVIVDLREDSHTFKEWMGIELSEESNKLFLVPDGFAHGFLTLEQDSEVVYFVSEFYAPEYERGLRFDDPLINIDWIEKINIVSDKDKNWDYLDKDFLGIKI